MAKKLNMTTVNRCYHFDYRHIICIIITFGFIACSVVVFPNALDRIVESVRDLGLSFAYYFCELFGINHRIVPTVTTLPSLSIITPIRGGTPTTSLPDTWTGFKSNWGIYWGKWANLENAYGYLGLLGNIIYKLCFTIILILPFVLGAVLLFRRYLKKFNNDYNKDSKPLRVFKWITAHTYTPTKNWIIEFISFIKAHSTYLKIWLFIWLYNFNVITVIIEFFAFYFYFAMSFDIASLYTQVYKFGLDLWAVIDFVPLWVWIIIAYFTLNTVAINMAYQRLYHRERRNRGFLNERGVVTIYYGRMGIGKTLQMTDTALSEEVSLRDMAYEIILETDMHFPNFPWIELELRLRWACQVRIIRDLPSCRKWVRNMRKMWVENPRDKALIFDYDYELYGLTYDDKLKLADIWTAIEDYACAYFVYTVQSSLLVANYSVRVDMLKADLGNFPLWDSDFFKRDSRLIDSYSRHSHILDFDMLRLGKTMLDENPNRNAFGFGVYLISEIDKERKNTPELKEVKANAEECNQKNDLFNILLKMSRHACVIANRVFIKVIADLQRPSSLGADALELGEIINIKDKGDMSPLLPFYSPFYILDLIYSGLKGAFDRFYSQYRFNRADNTLLLYIYKGIVAKLGKYCEAKRNIFSAQTLKLEIENGSREGEIIKGKWYRMPKKVYSKRYSTDCLSGIFETRAQANYVSIDDLREYADIMATNAELGLQNSHFQKEINTLNTVA